MAATHGRGRVSVQEYLRGEYEPDAEYVDGEIEERPIGEYDHASWQQAIQLWFWRRGTEWNVRVKPELRLQISPTRFRVPDVTVLDRDRPVEQVITYPPLAVFEVLSPEDTIRRMGRKLGDYAAMGIPEIWVVDPCGPVFQRYETGELRTAAMFGKPGERIHFSMSDIAALLD